MNDKYSVNDFLYWATKYTEPEKKIYSKAQIANIIGKAMLDFFDDSGTAF